jgi:hypothetical protein
MPDIAQIAFVRTCEDGPDRSRFTGGDAERAWRCPARIPVIKHSDM